MPLVKTISDLPSAAVDALNNIASKRGTTETEVLHHAISLEKQLDDEVRNGAKILIEKDDKSYMLAWPQDSSASTTVPSGERR